MWMIYYVLGRKLLQIGESWRDAHENLRPKQHRQLWVLSATSSVRNSHPELLASDLFILVFTRANLPLRGPYSAS